MLVSEAGGLFNMVNKHFNSVFKARQFFIFSKKVSGVMATIFFLNMFIQHISFVLMDKRLLKLEMIFSNNLLTVY